jgi:hypothetical protein
MKETKEAACRKLLCCEWNLPRMVSNRLHLVDYDVDVLSSSWLSTKRSRFCLETAWPISLPIRSTQKEAVQSDGLLFPEPFIPILLTVTCHDFIPPEQLCPPRSEPNSEIIMILRGHGPRKWLSLLPPREPRLTNQLDIIAM